MEHAAISAHPLAGPTAVPAPRRLPWVQGMLASLLLAVWVALNEVDRLSAQITTSVQLAFPFAVLMGPSPPRAEVWRELLATATVQNLLLAHLLIDLVLIALYGALGIRLLLGGAGLRRWVGILLAIAATVDLAENSVLLLGATSGWAAAVVPWVTRAKWFVIGVVLVTAGVWALRRRALIAEWIRRWRFGLRIQRFSLLLVAFMTALSIVPRDGVFDQLPDIQRSWSGGGHSAQLLAAAAAVAVMTIGLFVMGRLRSQHLYDELERVDRRGGRPDYPLSFWLIAPAVLWSLALLSPSGQVLWGRLVIASAILFAVAAWSWCLRFSRPLRSAESERAMGTGWVDAAVSAGDLLTVGLVAVAGIALVRSFTAPVVLGLDRSWGPGLLVVGLVVLLGVWPSAGALLTRLDGRDGDPGWLAVLKPGVAVNRPPWLVPVATVFVGLVMLWIAATPQISGLGVPATVTIAAGVLALFVGMMVIFGQDLRPPEVLAELGFHTTPVVVLLVVVLLGAELSPASTRIHGLRTLDSAVPARPGLEAVFDEWVRTTEGCGRDAGDGVRVRPMLLYAAEGGGIRAAYWTASSVDLITGQPSPCRAALLSAGASGGAVGLTLAQVTGPGQAAHGVRELSRSSALAEATLGMLLRDVLYGATGVPLPGRSRDWTDRAALIEQAWERAVPSLQEPFLAAERTSGPPGRLVLNSTSVSTGCRVFVSQVQLGAAATPPDSGPQRSGGRAIDCDGRQTPGGRSVDLFDQYAGPEGRCVGSLRSSTAALTASRFPYVTPAAAVGCPGGSIDQLVDGGYVENTGLGTLVDLAPELNRLVREEYARSRPDGTRELIVPVVVYLNNSPGADLLPPSRQFTQEGLVPPVAFARAVSAQNSPVALLQRAQAAYPIPAADGSGALPRRTVFVVYPATRPSITAPLGWTLSDASTAQMDAALADQQRTPCENMDAYQPEVRLLCSRGYGNLADLQTMLD